jgi:hypothetical protein
MIEALLAGEDGGGNGDGGLMGKLGGLSGGLAAAGPVAAVGLGVGQTISGLMKRKKADALLPTRVDPMTLRNLYAIRADRLARKNGTAFSSESAAQRQMTKSLGNQAFRSGGLNTSVLAQIMAQNAQANKASFGQDYNQLLSMETDLTKDVTQRAADIDQLRYAQMSAYGEQQKSAGQDNLLAAIGMGGLKGKDKDV